MDNRMVFVEKDHEMWGQLKPSCDDSLCRGGLYIRETLAISKIFLTQLQNWKKFSV